MDVKYFMMMMMMIKDNMKKHTFSQLIKETSEKDCWRKQLMFRDPAFQGPFGPVNKKYTTLSAGVQETETGKTP